MILSTIGDHFSMEDLACCLVQKHPKPWGNTFDPRKTRNHAGWHQDTPRSNTSYPDAIVDDYWRLCSRKKADIMMENVHIRRTPETFTCGKHPLLTIIGLGRQGRCSVTKNTSFTNFQNACSQWRVMVLVFFGSALKFSKGGSKTWNPIHPMFYGPSCSVLKAIDSVNRPMNLTEKPILCGDGWEIPELAMEVLYNRKNIYKF